MRIAKRMSYIKEVPHFNSIFNYYNDPKMRLLLKSLITKSALPLKLLEKDFAVDSTGFSTSEFARWFNIRFGRTQDTRMWMKAYIMSGVKTNIVTSVEVTEGTASDSKQFKYLLADTVKDFKIKEVSADKAYLSRENVKQIEDVGAVPYIPFKTNSYSQSRGFHSWNKMWHYYNLHKEEFLKHYHKRSNVETTMHMIKAKFGNRLRSKKIDKH